MPVWRKDHELARVTVHWIGMVIFSIGLTALFGQISGNSMLYSWGKFGTMSLPTASCILLSGIGFFLLSRGESDHGEN